MKVGDYVQYSIGVRGAKGFILREEKKMRYYDNMAEGTSKFYFTVRYLLPGGRIVDNIASKDNLIMLSEA